MNKMKGQMRERNAQHTSLVGARPLSHMVRVVKKAIKATGCVLLITAAAAAGTALWFGLSENHKIQAGYTQNDYSRVLQENIGSNPRVVDIAMLGAHDAFSDKLTRQSAVDPQNKLEPIMPLLSAVWGGAFARGNKAQRSDGYTQAKNGVRYFDVRVVWQDEEWQNFHSYISEPFENNLRHMLRFLRENPGELIIFDVQHHFPMDQTSQAMLDFIGTVKEEGMSLWDYVRFDPNETPLGSLRWKDATNGGGGAVVLVKIPQTPGCKYYEYTNETMRSNWHDKPTAEEILIGVEGEYAYLAENFDKHRDAFRVNQAQTTPGMGLKYWSLLHDAERGNAALLTHPDFDKWLEVMPIFMVNNSDTMADAFNDLVIERINAHNRGLG